VLLEEGCFVRYNVQRALLTFVFCMAWGGGISWLPLSQNCHGVRWIGPGGRQSRAALCTVGSWCAESRNLYFSSRRGTTQFVRPTCAWYMGKDERDISRKREICPPPMSARNTNGTIGIISFYLFILLSRQRRSSRRDMWPRKDKGNQQSAAQTYEIRRPPQCAVRKTRGQEYPLTTKKKWK